MIISLKPLGPIATDDSVSYPHSKSSSAAYFAGKVGNDDLQRIYGISFPDNKQLKVPLCCSGRAEMNGTICFFYCK